MNGNGVPCLQRYASRVSTGASSRLHGSDATVPTGVISVMPQTCSTRRPWRCSNALIIAGGAADPPVMIVRSRLKS